MLARHRASLRPSARRRLAPRPFDASAFQINISEGSHRISASRERRRAGIAIIEAVSKPTIRVSEAEAASDLRSLLARVRAGTEVVIERNAEAVAVLRSAAPNIRLLSESLRLANELGSNTTLDDEFGRDLETVISSHREPLTPPAWD